MPTAEEAKLWLSTYRQNESTLAHFGVLGMHWGQRRAQARTSNTPRKRLTKNQKEKLKTGAANALAIGAAVAYIAYAYGPLAKRALTSVALKKAAQRGAKAAVPILKAIGNKPVVSMAQGLDGVWRLAA